MTWPTAKAVVIAAIARVGSAGCERRARSTPTPVIPANVPPSSTAPTMIPAVPGTNAADITPPARAAWATTSARRSPRRSPIRAQNHVDTAAQAPTTHQATTSNQRPTSASRTMSTR